MKKILTGGLAALTIGAALAASAVPAAAYPYHGGWHGGYRGGWHGGGAVAVGVLAGAAIAGAYGPHYAYGPGYYGYGPRCRFETRWNPAWGNYENIRVCY